MCAMSMVYDHYNPLFQPTWPGPVPQPFLPPTPPPFYPWPPAPPVDLAQLARLIAEFKEAAEAAKVVDRLTGQPDCEDPEKARLEDRVAELERELARLKAAGAI